MPVFEIKTKEKLNVNGEFVDKGLSVQVSTITSNPFYEVDNVHKVFLRVHRIDLKSEGCVNMGYARV